MLVTLIKNKYHSILENKKTDSTTNKAKTVAWRDLTNDFNTTSGEEIRNSESLRNKYVNLKKRTKTKFSNYKKSMYKTGGGPYTAIDIDDTDTIIKEIIGNQLTGFQSEFDSDATHSSHYDEFCSDQKKKSNEEHEQIIVLIDNETCNSGNNDYINISLENESEVNKTNLKTQSISESNTEKVDHQLKSNYQNWSESTPKKLKTVTSQNLQTPKKGNDLKNKLKQWVKSKEETQLLRHRCEVNLHLLKLKHMEQKQQLFIKHEEELHKQKLRLNEEEHEIKMQILQIQKKLLTN